MAFSSLTGHWHPAARGGAARDGMIVREWRRKRCSALTPDIGQVEWAGALLDRRMKVREGDVHRSRPLVGYLQA
jgi:hypothetical protein